MVEDEYEEEGPEEETQKPTVRWGTTSSNNYSISLGNNSITYTNGWYCSGCGAYIGTYQFHNCPGAQPYRWYDYGTTTTTYYVNWKACVYCKAFNHDTPESCPRVKSIRYNEDGTVKSIKFHKIKD